MRKVVMLVVLGLLGGFLTACNSGEIETLKSRNAKLNAEKTDLTEANKKLQDDYDALKKSQSNRIVELEKKVSELEQKVQGMDAVTRERDSLKSENADLKAKLASGSNPPEVNPQQPQMPQVTEMPPDYVMAWMKRQMERRQQGLPKEEMPADVKKWVDEHKPR